MGKQISLDNISIGISIGNIGGGIGCGILVIALGLGGAYLRYSDKDRKTGRSHSSSNSPARSLSKEHQRLKIIEELRNFSEGFSRKMGIMKPSGKAINPIYIAPGRDQHNILKFFNGDQEKVDHLNTLTHRLPFGRGLTDRPLMFSRGTEDLAITRGHVFWWKLLPTFIVVCVGVPLFLMNVFDIKAFKKQEHIIGDHTTTSNSSNTGGGADASADASTASTLATALFYSTVFLTFMGTELLILAFPERIQNWLTDSFYPRWVKVGFFLKDGYDVREIKDVKHGYTIKKVMVEGGNKSGPYPAAQILFSHYYIDGRLASRLLADRIYKTVGATGGATTTTPLDEQASRRLKRRQMRRRSMSAESDDEIVFATPKAALDHDDLSDFPVMAEQKKRRATLMPTLMTPLLSDLEKSPRKSAAIPMDKLPQPKAAFDAAQLRKYYPGYSIFSLAMAFLCRCDFRIAEFAQPESKKGQPFPLKIGILCALRNHPMKQPHLDKAYQTGPEKNFDYRWGNMMTFVIIDLMSDMTYKEILVVIHKALDDFKNEKSRFKTGKYGNLAVLGDCLIKCDRMYNSWFDFALYSPGLVGFTNSFWDMELIWTTVMVREDFKGAKDQKKMPKRRNSNSNLDNPLIGQNVRESLGISTILGSMKGQKSIKGYSARGSSHITQQASIRGGIKSVPMKTNSMRSSTENSAESADSVDESGRDSGVDGPDEGIISVVREGKANSGVGKTVSLNVEAIHDAAGAAAVRAQNSMGGGHIGRKMSVGTSNSTIGRSSSGDRSSVAKTNSIRNSVFVPLAEEEEDRIMISIKNSETFSQILYDQEMDVLIESRVA